MSNWPPPTNKSPQMQRMISAISDRDDNIYDTADCAGCDKKDLKPEDFKDELSRREFGISRMCQECQDEIFG